MASNLFAQHPELLSAVQATLHAGLDKRGTLLSSSSATLASFEGGSSSSGAGARAAGTRMELDGTSPTAGDMDEEAAAQMRARAQTRGRRTVVFSAPVNVDESDSWTPQVVPKSEAEKVQIEGTLRANILFAGIDDDTRRVLADAMELKSFTAGDKVIRQGDPGDFYYCIREGSADVLVGDKVVLTLGPGKGFGELALLYDSPRAATVAATSTPLHCWAIDRDAFKHVTIGR